MEKKIDTTCPSCGVSFTMTADIEEPEPEVVMKDPDEALLKEKDEENTRLGVALATLEEKSATLQEKAKTFDGLATLLDTPEGFIDLANHLGYTNIIYQSGEAVSSGADLGEELKVEPQVIEGKTDKPGYGYLPSLDISIKKNNGG